MRLHVTCHGKKTTVSIDDLLIDYFGAWLVAEHPKFHANAKFQHKVATDFIRRHIAQQGDDLPTKNLSQHIQEFIIRAIAAPGLDDIIEARGPRYKKKKVDLRDIFPNLDEEIAAMRAQLEKNPLPTKAK